MPTSFKPKAKVAPQFQMSEKDIKQFYTQGFLGPFDAFSHDEMMDFKREVLRARERKEQDLRLGYAARSALRIAAVVELHEDARRSPSVVPSCLGPDLLVWRSQYFYKGPKSPAIQWHQASTFMVEDYQDPGIFPPDRSEIFQLTVWVAIDDATTGTRLLAVRRRHARQDSHDQFGGEEGFYKAAYTLRLR